MQKTKLKLQNKIETLQKQLNITNERQEAYERGVKNLLKEKDNALKTIQENQMSFNSTIRKYNKAVDELRADEITYKFTIATLQSTIAKMVK